MKLPGVNIQYPISQEIIHGRKIIETREYPLPDKYLGRDMFFIETPGISGGFQARIIGIIRFNLSLAYKNKKDFYGDVDKHLVKKNSAWAWKNKPKWAWHLVVIERFKQPVQAPFKKGIVFTSEIEIDIPF